MKTFVAKKARSFITDVDKLDVVLDGLLHNQVLHFCQNVHVAFLGRYTPTPLLSEFMAQVMTLLLRRCAGMELEVGMWIGLHIFANLLT